MTRALVALFGVLRRSRLLLAALGLYPCSYSVTRRRSRWHPALHGIHAGVSAPVLGGWAASERVVLLPAPAVGGAIVESLRFGLRRVTPDDCRRGHRLAAAGGRGWLPAFLAARSTRARATRLIRAFRLDGGGRRRAAPHFPGSGSWPRLPNTPLQRSLDPSGARTGWSPKLGAITRHRRSHPRPRSGPPQAITTIMPSTTRAGRPYPRSGDRACAPDRRGGCLPVNRS